MTKTAKIIVLALLVAAAVWFFRQPSYFLELLIKVNPLLTAEHLVNTQQLGDETNKLVAKARSSRKVTDQATLHNALMPSADRSAMLDNERDAWLARARRELPLLRQPVVYGYQSGPQSYFPAAEPVLVTLPPTDAICSGSRLKECSKADGIYPAGLPEEHDYKTTVVAEDRGGRDIAAPGNFRSHIARVCNGGRCSPWVETGFKYAVCPTGVGGWEQQWTNGFVRIGTSLDYRDFVGSPGAYTFEATLDDPRAKSACDANPGQAIVPLVVPGSGPAPPSTVLAQR